MKIKLTCGVKRGKTFYQGGKVYDFSPEEAKVMLEFGVPVDEAVGGGEALTSPPTDAPFVEAVEETPPTATEDKKTVAENKPEKAAKKNPAKKSAKKPGAKKKTTKTK